MCFTAKPIFQEDIKNVWGISPAKVSWFTSCANTNGLLTCIANPSPAQTYLQQQQAVVPSEPAHVHLLVLIRSANHCRGPKKPFSRELQLWSIRPRALPGKIVSKLYTLTTAKCLSICGSTSPLQSPLARRRRHVIACVIFKWAYRLILLYPWPRILSVVQVNSALLWIRLTFLSEDCLPDTFRRTGQRRPSSHIQY